MPIAAQLLGPPLLVRDGVVYPPRRGAGRCGRCFAYLALSERPPTRQLLDRPAVPRRRGPGRRPALEPVRAPAPARWSRDRGERQRRAAPAARGSIDRRARPDGGHLVRGRRAPRPRARAARGRRGRGEPGVHRVAARGAAAAAGAGGAVLREGALRALAAGNAGRAVELATRLVGVDPLNEDAHVLLVRAFAATGDEVAVQRQLAARSTCSGVNSAMEPGPSWSTPRAIEPRRAPRRPGRARCRPGRVGRGRGRRRGASTRGSRTCGSRGAGARRARPTSRRPRCSRSAPRSSTRRRAGRGGRRGAAPAIAAAEAPGSAERGGGPPRARVRRAAPRRVPPGADLAAGGGGARRRRPARALADPLGRRGGARRRRAARAGRGRATRSRSGSAGSAGQRQAAGLGAGVPRADAAAPGRARPRRGRRSSGRAGLTKGERWTAFLAYPESLLAEVWVREGDLDRAAEASSTRSPSGARSTTPAGRRTGCAGSGCCVAAAATSTARSRRWRTR